MAKALRDAKAKAPKIAGKTPAGGNVDNDGKSEPVTGDQGGTAAAGDTGGGETLTLMTSTNQPPESDDQGGAGNTAGSAGPLFLDDAHGALDGRGEHLDAEAEFRAKFPRMSAALDAWKAEKNGGELPAALLIRSKIDGFRRAGIAHSKAPIEHQLGAFKGPEQMEALFAEPNLVVELI